MNAKNAKPLALFSRLLTKTAVAVSKPVRRTKITCRFLSSRNLVFILILMNSENIWAKTTYSSLNGCNGIVILKCTVFD